jgi:peptidoglycan/LPS O-acetylase OafA/YrhL
MRYFEAGDAMRGWGVLAVVLGHSAATALVYTILKDPDATALALQTRDIGFENLFDSRQVGAAILATQLVVFLFFALSAYLLSRPYVAAMFGQARRSPPLGDYVKHRIGRVVPPFWVFIVITILWFGTTGTSFGEMVAMFAFGQVWTSAPFNEHLSQAWTLNVEIVFYIALPILAGFAGWAMKRGGRGAGWIALAPIVVVAVLAGVFSSTWLPDTTVRSQSPIGGLLTFLPGVLIAVVEVRWGERIGRIRGAHVVAILLALFGLGVAYKQSSLVAGGSDAERNVVTLAAGSLLAGVVLWQLTGRKTWRGLTWKPMQWVGERSFSIYLVHGLALWELRNVGGDQPTVGRYFLLLAMAVIPVSVVFGGILYALVERPSIRISRGERPIFGEGPVTRRSTRAPTIGTTRDEAPAADLADPRTSIPAGPTGAAGISAVPGADR